MFRGASSRRLPEASRGSVIVSRGRCYVPQRRKCQCGGGGRRGRRRKLKKQLDNNVCDERERECTRIFRILSEKVDLVRHGTRECISGGVIVIDYLTRHGLITTCKCKCGARSDTSIGHVSRPSGDRTIWVNTLTRAERRGSTGSHEA